MNEFNINPNPPPHHKLLATPLQLSSHVNDFSGMETGDASSSSKTTSSTEASCPVQDASQATPVSQEALGDEATSSFAAAGMAAEGENILTTGEALETAVMEIVALGYTKDQALVAMAGSCNDPNRAVDFLLSVSYVFVALRLFHMIFLTLYAMMK